jgi:hypothetical protein
MLIFLKWLSIISPIILISFSTYYLIKELKLGKYKSKNFVASMIFYLMAGIIGFCVVIYMEVGAPYVI